MLPQKRVRRRNVDAQRLLSQARLATNPTTHMRSQNTHWLARWIIAPLYIYLPLEKPRKYAQISDIDCKIWQSACFSLSPL